MTNPNIILLLESEVGIKLFPLIILSIMEQNISIIDGRSGGRGRGGQMSRYFRVRQIAVASEHFSTTGVSAPI
jgi:hypothetical protein